MDGGVSKQTLRKPRGKKKRESHAIGAISFSVLHTPMEKEAGRGGSGEDTEEKEGRSSSREKLKPGV